MNSNGRATTSSFPRIPKIAHRRTAPFVSGSTMTFLCRREFLASSTGVLAAAGLGLTCQASEGVGNDSSEAAIAFGLVTYMWGADWDLPTLLTNCAKTNCRGVELRTTHAHKVEPDLNEKQRAEVAARFADAGVVCVGIGSNERFDDPKPDVLKQ